MRFIRCRETNLRSAELFPLLFKPIPVPAVPLVLGKPYPPLAAVNDQLPAATPSPTQLHHDRLPVKCHLVADRQLLALLHFDHAIDCYLARADLDFCLAAGIGEPAELNELAEL